MRSLALLVRRRIRVDAIELELNGETEDRADPPSLPLCLGSLSTR